MFHFIWRTSNILDKIVKKHVICVFNPYRQTLENPKRGTQRVFRKNIQRKSLHLLVHR